MSCISAVYSQGEIDMQQRVFYRNEWSVALMINSNGFGGNYRYGERINAANKRLYEIDFAYIKDPKEYKTPAVEQTMIVYGKKNLAFNFRFSYGKQHEKFRKHYLGGIAIRRFYNFGPSVILLKPIYYYVGDGYPLQKLEEPETFNHEWISFNKHIMSRASFFKGFNEISPVFGAFAKFGYNFEFGSHDRIIHALEAGFIGEGFLKKIEIMDFSANNLNQKRKAKNQQLFLTIFLSYRFGRIVDPYEVKKKRERSREISY